MHRLLNSGLLLVLVATAAHPVLARTGDEGFFVFGDLLYQPEDDSADTLQGSGIGMEVGGGYYLNETFGVSASFASLPGWDRTIFGVVSTTGEISSISLCLNLRYGIGADLWIVSRIGIHQSTIEFTVDSDSPSVTGSLEEAGSLGSIALAWGLQDQMSVMFSYTRRSGGSDDGGQYEFSSDYAVGLSWEF